MKRTEITNQKLTSDGITQKALLTIYQELYHRFDVLKEDKWVKLLPHRTLTHISQDSQGFKLTASNALSQHLEAHQADIVILATGFEAPYPTFLRDLLPLLDMDEHNRYQMNANFELKWEGQQTNKIFAVNAGMHSHGIAEPQLSLMAWRSAKIINRLAGETLFDTDAGQGMIDWLSPTLNGEKTTI